ncbi:hypothetical protein [Sphingobacterium kyonggiense]
MDVLEGAKVERTELEQSGSVVKVEDRETDKGVTVTERETVTTTIKEGSKIRVTAKKDDLKPGENFLRDSAGQLVKAILDTLNKTLTIEVTTPSEKTEQVVKEKITDKRDVTKDRKEERKDTTSKQVAIQAEQSRRESSATEESDSRPNIWAVLVSKIGWGIALLIILLGVALWMGFRLKRSKV